MNAPTKAKSVTADRIPVIDVDFHPMPRHFDEGVRRHLPQRWRDYIPKYGLGQGQSPFTGSPPQREMTHRLDAIDPSGRVGTDPDFAKRQVLDEYGLSGAILTNVSHIVPCGPNRPADLTRALNAAFNDCIAEEWLTADPRYYSAIGIARDLAGAAEEIRRCKEGPMGDRFVEVMISPAGAEPLGKERYWPLFEACEAYGLPLACHVPAAGAKGTAGGATSYYAELHMNLVSLPMTTLASLIFEGVFDRFPKLQVAFVELGWSWAPTYSWRMDRLHDRLRDEVRHLTRRPSEYMQEHVWYATQPIEEPERQEHEDSVYRLMEESGFGDRLMYSSDYPHWDFDAPGDSVAPHHPEERRRRILGENASRLYGIPLLEGTGIPVAGKAA